MDQHHHNHSIQPPQFPSIADAPPSFTGFIPSQPAPPPSHPSYAEMITAAIVWDNTQGKEGGSSKRAIAKYIDRVYTHLPPNHSSLLTHYLKELKHNGYLVMVKNSYQLASFQPNTTGEDVPANPALSHTGSDPLIHPPDLNTGEQQMQQQSAGFVDPTPKRRPGRPPKSRSDPVQENGVSVGVGEGGAQSLTGRKRGRPPKQQVIRPHNSQAEHQIMMEQNEAPQPMPESEPLATDGIELQKRRPGRPPKLTPVVPARNPVQVQLNGPDHVVEGSESVMVKRKPGRPARKNVGGNGEGGVVVGKPRGRPKGSVLGVFPRPIGKRPRGRPPRAGGGAVVVGKRRGRPPKVSGPPKVKRLSASGKPMGRPRKNAVNSSEQMVNEELTKKLDLIQSKIRDTVDVLRPYIPNENAPLMALQQLEELAAPIVMATPMNEIAPMPVNMNAPMPPVSMNAPMPPVNMNTSMPPVNMNAPMLPVNMNAPPPTGATSAPPSDSVSAPYMNVPGPFSVNLPQMTVSAPFQVPSSFNPQRMSWMPSNGAQS